MAGKKKEFNVRTYVLAWLRRGSYRVPMRYAVLNAAKVERGKYRCAKCDTVYGRKDIQVDHINPVVDPNTGFTTWDDYINRLFCPSEGLQVLCKPCHKEKSGTENKKRTKVKKKKLQFNKRASKIKP